MLRGNMGREGAGACPVRGHSNVQGDRTMGIYEKPPQRCSTAWTRCSASSRRAQNGYDTVEAIAGDARRQGQGVLRAGRQLRRGHARHLRRPGRRCSRCDLTVHVTTKLNRSHLVHGREALMLPCLGRTEIDMQAAGPQGVTVEDSMSMVHISTRHQRRRPRSTCCRSRPSWRAWPPPRMRRAQQDAVAVAGRGLRAHPRQDRSGVRRLQGLQRADRGAAGGFRLRNTATRARVEHRRRKAVFFIALPCRWTRRCTAPARAARRSGDTIVFTLLTARSHDQYNTTIYGMDDRYRGVFGQRRVVFINKRRHPQARHEGRRLGRHPDRVGRRGRRRQERSADRFKLVAYDIPRGNIAAYYPETNPLVPLDSVALNAGTPTSKSIPVILRRTRHRLRPRPTSGRERLRHRLRCGDDHRHRAPDRRFPCAILRTLGDAPRDGGVSLPRLGKQLGQGASVLMRQLTLMGDATIGGRARAGLGARGAAGRPLGGTPGAPEAGLWWPAAA